MAAIPHCRAIHAGAAPRAAAAPQSAPTAIATSTALAKYSAASEPTMAERPMAAVVAIHSNTFEPPRSSGAPKPTKTRGGPARARPEHGQGAYVMHTPPVEVKSVQ